MARKKEKAIESGVGVLKLKLGACMSGPTSRMDKDLAHVAQLCNRVRNHMVRLWERWQEDHPDYQPQKVTTARGKEHQESPLMSYECEQSMYGVPREATPHLSATIAATLRNEVIDRLKGKLPYNHGGESRFRWEGILEYEVSRDCYRAEVIPVPNSTGVLCYNGDCSRELSSGVMAAIRAVGKASCVIRFPIWSEQAGREHTSVIARLDVADMPRGMREVLKKVATKEWKMSDSKIVRKGKNWFLHLVYCQPRQDLGLPQDHIATIECLPPDAHRPMAIGEETGKRWLLGDVGVLTHECGRLEMRRKVLQERYRNTVRGKPGHGKGHFYAKLRPGTDKLRAVSDRFSKNLVSEIIKFCIRYRTGTVVYREPSLNLRGIDWFTEKKLPFDWTAFLTQLKHQCWLYGIDLKVERMGCKEYKERYKQMGE